MLFEEIAPREPLVLHRLRRRREAVCLLFVTGALVSALAHLVELL